MRQHPTNFRASGFGGGKLETALKIHAADALPPPLYLETANDRSRFARKKLNRIEASVNVMKADMAKMAKANRRSAARAAVDAAHVGDVPNKSPA